MLNCRMGWHQILCLLCFHFFLHSSLRFALPLCPLDQRDALLHFKNSFVLDSKASDPCQWHPIDSAYQTINPVESYPKTNSWYKGMDCCSWDGVACDGATGNIIGLDLTCSWLRGTLHSNSSLFLLRYLRSLNLFGNNFVGSHISSNLSAFATLTHLNLSSSSFLGSVPSEISHLSKLVSLDLSNNYIFDTYSSSHLGLENSIFTMLVQNLTTLRKLVLDEVDMSMVSPKSFANLSSSLTYLSVCYCSLGGIFPDAVFRLPSLTSLYICANYNLSGNLPKSNWTSPLESLSLWSTNFSGEIPNSIGNMKNLTILDIESCQFTGKIPLSTWNLNQLQVLWIDGNSFSGVVEFELFAKLKNLRMLLVSQELNLIYDTLEYTFPKLEELRLHSCNLTKFPYFLNSLKRLTRLDLSSNRISGEIPMWFWGISHDTLDSLDLSNNLLEGGIQLLHWKKLSKIELWNNSFHGPLPILPPSTYYFDASYNNFICEIPSLICQVSSLQNLELSNNNLFGNMPSCFGNITNLRSLNLRGNKLQGSLPRSLVKCVNLSTLSLGHNEFNDIFPHWLEAPQLHNLDLRSNKFYGRINLTVFGLSFLALETLVISNNNFTGQWPIHFFSNTSLYIIDLSNNKFEGPIPLPSLVTYYYSIASNNMTGKIPSLICNATQLVIIDLSNNILTGSLPRCLTNFSPNLLVLNLRMNHLEGKIPHSFSSRSGLMTLDLSRNQFEGTLPQSLVKCRYLEVLDLSHNQIEDTFPRWLGTLPNLKVLVLKSNNLKDVLDIPMGAHLFSKLHILDLSNNNFNGPLPVNLIMNLKGMMNGENVQDTSLYMTRSFKLRTYENSVAVTLKGPEIELVRILTFLTIIDLSCNSFQGNIPEVIGYLHSLVGLNLSHNHLTGSIPPTLGNLTNLEWLDLSYNEFNDIFPHWLEAPRLAIIDLSNNKFGGPIPLPSPVTYYYSIASNNITGKIPSLICNATQLVIIDLSNNNLTGSLPRCLTNFSPYLSVLNLRMNHLEGKIPLFFFERSGLMTLDLSRNQFEGTLPQSLVKCRYLEVLDLSHNQIEDTFPRWLGALPNLKVLVLKSNNLKDLLDIPMGANLFSKLHILDLSNNNFSGPLPVNLIMNLKGMMNGENVQDTSLYMTRSFDQQTYENSVAVTMKGLEVELVRILTFLTIIDLSCNSFQGNIPEVIGHLHSLVGLNLSHNHLTGSIPSTLGNLTNLEWLDLSLNKLSQVIPRKLGDLAFLEYLNLSKNQLSGRIPQDKQLSTFSRDSFSENPGLCGTPLPKACLGNAQPPSPSSLLTFDCEGHESWFNQKIVWMGYASGIVIGISIAYITFETGRPKWLMQGVRMLESRAVEWIEKSKRKAIKFHG